MNVTGTAEDMSISFYVQTEIIAPHISRPEYITRVDDSDGCVLRQRCVLAVRAGKVEDFQ